MSKNISEKSLEEKISQANSVSFPAKFLLFCAGAKTRHIYKPECQKDRSKYTSIGATILITAIMAGVSGGYALFTVFQSPAIAATLGSFWGITIFNLDRSFTSTTKKTKDNKNLLKQTLATGIRLSLAILVGLVIAKPFEIKVFESKINETIARETLIKNRETRNSTFEASKIEELKNELSQLESDAKKKEAEWLKWEDLANKEAEGIVGTGLRGKGIVYDEKKDTATQLRQQLENLRDSLSKKEEEIIRFEELQNNTIAEIEDVTKITIVDQLSTLHKLAEEEDIIFWSSLAISSLLIAIEISPLLVKILAPYGTYDSLTETEEENFIDIQEQKKISVKEAIETENRIRNNIRERTATFIDKQYIQVLEGSIEHEKIKEVREKIIFDIAKIVEQELSQRTQDVSKLGLEINKSINDIIHAETKNQFEEKVKQDNINNQLNDLFEKMDNFTHDMKNNNSNILQKNGKHS